MLVQHRMQETTDSSFQPDVHAGGFDDNRYTPRSAHDSVPPPDVAAGAVPPARSSAGFVRGGTLGTVARGTELLCESKNELSADDFLKHL